MLYRLAENGCAHLIKHHSALKLYREVHKGLSDIPQTTKIVPEALGSIVHCQDQQKTPKLVHRHWLRLCVFVHSHYALDTQVSDILRHYLATKKLTPKHYLAGNSTVKSEVKK